MNCLWRHKTHAAHELNAYRDPAHDGISIQTALLGNGKYGGNNDRAGMHRTPFEGIIVILAMRGGAIDQCRIIGAEASLMTDSRRGAILDRARARGSHIILVARGHA